MTFEAKRNSYWQHYWEIKQESNSKAAVMFATGQAWLASCYCGHCLYELVLYNESMASSRPLSSNQIKQKQLSYNHHANHIIAQAGTSIQTPQSQKRRTVLNRLSVCPSLAGRNDKLHLHCFIFPTCSSLVFLCNMTEMPAMHISHLL